MNRVRSNNFLRANGGVDILVCPGLCVFFTSLVCALFILSSPTASAGIVVDRPPRAEPTPEELQNITIVEHLNAALPLDAAFTDELNHPVTLKQYFQTSTRPVILQLGYYGCPMLCDLISRGVTDSLKEVELTAGKDFDVVFISIDPTESYGLAQKKKRSYVTEYARAGSESGWHFLTGKQDQIEKVSRAFGFNYKWIPSAAQFSHPAAIAICTPDGKISRYLYGVKFDEKTLRLSLVEASAGKIGTTTDHFLLTCFRYDGKQGKYAMTAIALMRFGGAATVIILGSTLFVLFRREARRRSLESHAAG